MELCYKTSTIAMDEYRLNTENWILHFCANTKTSNNYIILSRKLENSQANLAFNPEIDEEHESNATKRTKLIKQIAK